PDELDPPRYRCQPRHQRERLQRLLPEAELAAETSPFHHRERELESQALRPESDAFVHLETRRELWHAVSNHPAVVADGQEHPEVHPKAPFTRGGLLSPRF